MGVYKTEIASDTIKSDNPIHQRLLQAYFIAKPYIKGDLLEIGCGEGRGVKQLAPLADNYTGIDKITSVINSLSDQYPEHNFSQMNIPPIKDFPDNSFDTIVSFQVIEHIEDDNSYLEEIHRLLKKGGRAIITTPNRKMSLSRNPWHVREYLADELGTLCEKYFSEVEIKGITGNERVMKYYERNKKSVDKIMRWDIFDLQHRLPASWLRVPYEVLNRFNRNKLYNSEDDLASQIVHDDYFKNNEPENSIDLLAVVQK